MVLNSVFNLLFGPLTHYWNLFPFLKVLFLQYVDLSFYFHFFLLSSLLLLKVLSQTTILNTVSTTFIFAFTTKEYLRLSIDQIQWKFFIVLLQNQMSWNIISRLLLKVGFVDVLRGKLDKNGKYRRYLELL